MNLRITDHPTREGKVDCAVVLDAFSRRVVGWSISWNPTAALTEYALDMAVDAIHFLSVYRELARPRWCHRWAPSATATTTR